MNMLRIRKLDIFVAKEFGLLFIGAFFICQFVLMMQFLWQYIDNLIGKGLSMEVMAQFFWHMALMLVPQALPLAILLSSLITFGNLGESSELTAIKSSGISLMQTFRPLIVIVLMICGLSFYFQNNIGPASNNRLAQLLLSMKQKSPELEIPEGIFYDGIPNCNLYVQKKDMETGKLYGIMIYRMTGSYEDQAIILADSGMLQSTAEKKHLLLTLWSGEWFENMQNQEMAGTASIPYRRETFFHKQIVLDYDGDFSLMDANYLSNNARGKSLQQIDVSIDSLNHTYDSIGRAFYKDAKRGAYYMREVSARDSMKAIEQAKAMAVNVDTIFHKLTDEKKREVMNRALNKVKSQVNDLEFKAMVAHNGEQLLREHRIERIKKFTLAFSCVIFFFIGAPLGAIIRKGGLGFPILISVLVFIIFYILDNTGYRMARGGMWAVWFGQSIATAVLTPTAAFITYKANNDSMVFNIDAYKNFFIQLLGLPVKRHIFGKEVIINDPDYERDAQRLTALSQDITDYSQRHRLYRAPNPIKVFFQYEADHETERISEELESVIEDLANTRDKVILTEINHYPVIAVKAHTRPFERPWLNMVAGLLVPIGIILYLRMWRFRVRLYHEMRTILQTNSNIISRIGEMTKGTEGNM